MFKLRSACVALALFATAVSSTSAFAAQNRNVEIANKAGVTMTAFHASRANLTDWQENIIAGHQIRSGASLVIDINDGTSGCVYDFKATFADGEEVVSENNNVCELELFTFE